ncbi:MAG: MHYT domain-containing protein [Cyanobacteria bacterium J06636_16]
MTALLPTGYNVQLVAVSVAIAILASYTFIDLAGRVTATQGRAQVSWWISGTTAMGIGIWSMHFMGMLAFRLPLSVQYDFLTVLTSILPAIFASGLALFLVSRSLLGWQQLLGGSLLMGLGIASMHYIGMDAMRTTAAMHYDLRVVVLSILIAIVVSFAGLFLVFRLREETTPHQLGKKLLAATVMGAAIPTMHYTGMAAVSFQSGLIKVPTANLEPPQNAALLAIGVIICTLIILGFALLTAFFERRLSAQVIYAQALQENQAYLKAILQGIQVGVMMIEEDTQLPVANQAALDLLHLSNMEALQKLWDCSITEVPESLPSDHQNDLLLQAMQPVFQKIAAKQPIRNRVVQVSNSADAPLASLLINAVPLSLFESSPTQMVCTFSEITELKQAENRLKASEAKFRDLAKQEELLNQLSTQIRQSLDLNTILQTAVCRVREIFASDRTLIYQFDQHWRGQVILEDAAVPWLPTLGEAVDDCFPEKCLDYYRNGGVRAINDILEAGLDGEHLYFLQRLQVRANLIVPIMVCNELWGLLIVHQCSRPRDWQEEEGSLLHRLGIQLGIAIQQSDLYAQAQQNALQAQAQAQQLRESEAQLKQKTQKLQQTLQDLQSLQLQLVQSEKMSSLGQLVAGVAHEINNPVNFIHGNLRYVEEHSHDLLGFIQVYQKYYPNPAPEVQIEAEEVDLEFLQKDLGKILKSMKVGTERIREIVLSLRNFSRMDEAELKTVDIHEGIDSTLMILHHRLKETRERSGVQILRNYAELPLIECYASQLNQVFMNILANAIDALEDMAQQASQPQKEVFKEILISTSLKKESQIIIKISDNGLGIPEDVRLKIFNPFFTTKPVGKGTGIGLSISHQIIVEEHGGMIECFSTPDQGTEFVIQLPIRQTA